MVKANSTALKPVWLVPIGVALLAILALKAQPISLPGHLLGMPSQVTSTQRSTGPGSQPGQGPALGGRSAAESAAGSHSASSIAVKTGTTSPASATQNAPVAPVESAGVNETQNNPCARTTKPAPMCPVVGP